MNHPALKMQPTLNYETLDANEAVAKIAYKLSEVIAIYLITPSSPMGEFADAWSSENKPNLWGSVPSVIEMQSEGGAAGAKVAMLCSVLLREGTKTISTILKGIEDWMEEHEYVSIQQMQGSMSQKNCEHTQEFERAQYMKSLHSVHIVHH